MADGGSSAAPSMAPKRAADEGEEQSDDAMEERATKRLRVS